MAIVKYGCIARYIMTNNEDDPCREKLVLSIEKEPKGYVMILKKSGGGKRASVLVIPPQRWVNLGLQMSHVNDIIHRMRSGGPDSHVKENIRVSGNLYISIESPYWYVNMRQYYMNSDGELKPGRNGVSLRFNEWSKLCYQGVEMIKFHIPEILDLQPCATRIDHHEEDNAMDCPECTPATGTAATA